MVFVEYQKQIDEFLLDYNNNDVIIFPVMQNGNLHILNNEISFIIVKILQFDRYYVLSFNHNDCNNLPISFLNSISNTNNKKYTYNKKQLLQIFEFKNVIDINLLNYLNTNNNLEKNIEKSKSELFYNYQYKDILFINNIIPINNLIPNYKKFIDLLETVILDNRKTENESFFNYMNNDTIQVFADIEKNGIYVDSAELLKVFPNVKNHIKNNYIYSEYNIYTSTGRPSNRFGGINFSALNKKTDDRLFITSRFQDNGSLLLFDYNSFHLRLISHLVNYTFPEKSIHTYLGKQYFNKDELTELEYNQSKEISFTLLYGNIDEKTLNAFPFFKKSSEYTKKLWEFSIKNGYIETSLFKRKMYIKNIHLYNKNILFNYLLQSYETEYNIIIMKLINDYLKNYKTKLILYSYDSFLFDYCFDDTDECILGLKNIIEKDNFFTKISVGHNFKEMIKI